MGNGWKCGWVDASDAGCILPMFTIFAIMVLALFFTILILDFVAVIMAMCGSLAFLSIYTRFSILTLALFFIICSTWGGRTVFGFPDGSVSSMFGFELGLFLLCFL